MKSTLFYIPHADPFLGIPLFGFGWLLLAWAVASVVLLATLIRRNGWSRETRGYLPVLLIIGGVIAWGAPLLEERTLGDVPIGVPIRGYGVMLLLGIVGGIGLSAHQARRVGMDPEIIVTLCFWLILFGIVGARTFYVIEYWDQFSQPTLRATLVELFRFTEGGIVVYGSLIGGIAAFAVFVIRKRLPALAVGDLLAPGVMLGLAVGRIGCLLNGCCWGGACGQYTLGLTFPAASPPYVDQLENGTLLGMRLERQLDDRDGTLVVRQVRPGSPAQQQGFQVGDRIIGVELPAREELLSVRRREEQGAGSLVTLTTSDGRRVSWEFRQLPVRSLPVYPTQVFSSINAALLCWLLWAYYPGRRRDGEVLALMLTIYPITRFLLEMVRTDEAGLLQSDVKLTISQAISGLFLVGVAALWWFILSRPPGRLAVQE